MDFQSCSRCRPRTLGESLRLPQRGMLISWQQQEGPFLQAGVRWKSTKDTKRNSKDTIIDKVTSPSKTTIVLSLSKYLSDTQLTWSIPTPDIAVWLKCFRTLDKDLKNLLHPSTHWKTLFQATVCGGGLFRLALHSSCYRAQEGVAASTAPQHPRLKCISISIWAINSFRIRGDRTYHRP